MIPTDAPPDPLTESVTLRQRAEDRLQTMDIPAFQALTPEAASHLWHELRVHQIELEMQNEDLLQTQQALEASRSRYFDLYDLAPVGYLTLSKTGLIQEANLAAASLLNARRCHLARQPLSHFILAEDQDVFYDCRRRLWSTGEPQTCEVRLHGQEGTRWIRLETSLVPTDDPDPGTPLWRAVLSDISDLKQIEQQLQTSLAEKTLLVKEIHHRVKNNLQVIVSLLNLQVAHVQHADTREALRDMQGRIRSMALLHETLYKRGAMGGVDGAVYLALLCDQLSQSFGLMAGRVRLQHRLTSTELPQDQAITCGLIVNELVSNAFRHAFPDERSGQIQVVLAVTQNGRRMLAVSDDGVGMPPGLDWQNSASLGLQLVPGLARQLGGELELRQDTGTRFSLTFPGPP